MISFVRNITVKFISYAMIAVMGLLVTNKAIYSHSHLLADGKVYTHAHPYNKTNDSKPFKTHHHSRAEFLFYENLDILFLFSFLIALTSFVFKRIQSNCFVEELYIRFFFQFLFRQSPSLFIISF